MATVSEETVRELRTVARECRRNILEMTTEAGSGHPGGSMSAIDIMACLFFQVMRHRPNEPKWPDRDRFVLSKGHCTPALYSVLAAAGYLDREELKSFRKIHSRLQGHCENMWLPILDVSTVSLGQGLSQALGLAIAQRLDGRPGRVYAMVGDGESQEGQVWEAAMAASHYGVDNLCGILDYNRYQIDGNVNEIMNLEPVAERWGAFGWHVLSIDGHDYEAILNAFEEAGQTRGKPTMVVANTIKSKGVSFMEGTGSKWHGKPLSRDQLEKALEELAEEPAA